MSATPYIPPIRPTQERALRPIDGTGAAAERRRQHNYFLIHLRASTTRKGTDFKENAINTHDDALIALDKWLTSMDFPGDYRDVDTATLGAFLKWWSTNYTQGGANTKQRKLSKFFRWLSEEYGTPNPYTDKLARYAPAKPGASKKVLDDEVVRGMLRVTSGKDFESVRDHAIIRVLVGSGMRRGQCAFLRVEDIDLRGRTATVIGQKGWDDGHRKPFDNKAAEALARYLRMRSGHKLAGGAEWGWLWLGTRGRGHLSGNAILQMLKRRAEQSGFARSAVHAHMFRHTYAHHHLASGGSETDLMNVMSWSDPAMVRVYAAELAEQRALEDARRRSVGGRY